MDRIVTVGGKSVTLRATAALPRRFRACFGVDFFSELENINKANKSIERKAAELEQIPETPDNRADLGDKRDALEGEKIRLSGMTMELFEEMAFVMARSADPANVPPSIVDWLDTFDDPNAILTIADDVIDLYRANNQMVAAPKKKSARQSGK